MTFLCVRTKDCIIFLLVDISLNTPSCSNFTYFLFVPLSKVTLASSIYLDYSEYKYRKEKKIENNTKIVKLSKKRTPLIRGQISLHQQCPLIGERTVY